jgi:hypothetical protein
MSVLVHVVVGELDLVECDVTLHPVRSAGRAVGMHVQPIQLHSSNGTVLLYNRGFGNACDRKRKLDKYSP